MWNAQLRKGVKIMKWLKAKWGATPKIVKNVVLIVVIGIIACFVLLNGLISLIDTIIESGDGENFNINYSTFVGQVDGNIDFSSDTVSIYRGLSKAILNFSKEDGILIDAESIKINGNLNETTENKLNKEYVIISPNDINGDIKLDVEVISTEEAFQHFEQKGVMPKMEVLLGEDKVPYLHLQKSDILRRQRGTSWDDDGGWQQERLFH